jgi:hypothetical protein
MYNLFIEMFVIDYIKVEFLIIEYEFKWEAISHSHHLQYKVKKIF